ncbi:hypothetical protein LCL95_07220 [Bacillus timonensis]|nr:hypothetical protein [Bacillus timonensis]
MKFVKRNWLFFIGIGAVCIVLLMAIHNLENKNEAENGLEREVERVKNGVETSATYNQSVGEKIHNIHEYYNDILTFKKWESYTDPSYSGWKSEKKMAEGIIKSIDTMLKDSNSSNLHSDLNNAKKLIQIAISNHDPTALIYLHRIFHDLDILYNGYREELWGFTHYQSNGKGVRTVEKHINMYSEE